MTTINPRLHSPPTALRPYTAYTYAYPHKTAYRPLAVVRALSDVWSEEDRSRLFLYVHIPFCEVRCGFCNLFTIARASGELSTDYLAALSRQLRAVRRALPDAQFSRLAIGGGTPTYLHTHELQQLFEMLRDQLGVDPREIPASCEASPGTIDRDKLRLLADWGIDRLSMGVQSFDQREAAAMGRPQQTSEVERALSLLAQTPFATRNLDLIYGADHQSIESFLASVQRAVDYGVEELFLYPLYVRQLTGLGKRQQRSGAELYKLVGTATDDLSDDDQWDRHRLECYHQARQLLLSAGYQQLSMRNFLRRASTQKMPEYCCQTDGMIGLGCGARSYTRQLHYSGEYAVGVTAIKGILLNYIGQGEAEFSNVNYGFELNMDEQQRRFLLMSLLQAAGLERRSYTDRFGTDAVDDFPQLRQLEEGGWATISRQIVRLTDDGLAWTDAIGPWLYSQPVKRLSETYQWQ